MNGSHTLEAFTADVASSIQQPGATVSLADYSVHHPPSETPDAEPTPARTDAGFKIGALGAGSDYQGFLDYLGVASLNDQFSGQTRSGIYHSIYDSIYWYTHFSDTNLADGRALAEYTTTALLRLADAPVLPFEFGRFASTVGTYADEIQKEADTAGHKLDLARVRKQLDLLKEKNQNYEALLEVAMQKQSFEPSHLAELNSNLIGTERTLTNAEGLPNRPWYKHQIYAPGFYTGYAVKTLPGIREAVETKNWKLAQQEASIVEHCLADMNEALGQAIDDLSGL
ncbi:MAG: hypothetical protein JO061_12755 [Acidobacteriaceae bacterium]|nr:hypothetical protein [Acidobacteriaceae bacterium]